MPEFIQSPFYAKAPIIEAVIDFRVAGEVKQATQQKFVKKLSKAYPHSDAMQKLEVKFDTTGGTVKVDQQLTGHRITSDDLLDVVVVQPNGLTVSRKAPYLGWKPIIERAKDHWKTWRDIVGASPITRIGVRYINRIDIPLAGEARLSNSHPTVDLRNYVNYYAHDPAMNENPLEGYLVQTIKDAQLPNWRYTLTSTLATPPPLINHLSIVLDIDVFRLSEIPQHPDRLWETVSEARDIKNDLFERCITDSTRELLS